MINYNDEKSSITEIARKLILCWIALRIQCVLVIAGIGNYTSIDVFGFLKEMCIYFSMKCKTGTNWYSDVLVLILLGIWLV